MVNYHVESSGGVTRESKIEQVAESTVLPNKYVFCYFISKSYGRGDDLVLLSFLASGVKAKFLGLLKKNTYIIILFLVQI